MVLFLFLDYSMANSQKHMLKRKFVQHIFDIISCILDTELQPHKCHRLDRVTSDPMEYLYVF